MREQILFDLCRHAPISIQKRLKKQYKKLHNLNRDSRQVRLFSLLWKYVEAAATEAQKKSLVKIPGEFDRKKFRAEAGQVIGGDNKTYQDSLSDLFETCLYQFDFIKRKEINAEDLISRLDFFLAIGSRAGASYYIKALKKNAKHAQSLLERIRMLSQEFRFILFINERHLDDAYDALLSTLNTLMAERDEPEARIIIDYYTVRSQYYRKPQNVTLRQRIKAAYDCQPKPTPNYQYLDSRLTHALLHARVARTKGQAEYARFWLEETLRLYDAYHTQISKWTNWDIATLTDLISTLIVEKDEADARRYLHLLWERIQHTTFHHKVQGINTYCDSKLSLIIQSYGANSLPHKVKLELTEIQQLYSKYQHYFNPYRKYNYLYLACAFHFVRQEYVETERYYRLLVEDKHVTKDHYTRLVRPAELIHLSALIVNNMAPSDIIYSHLDRIYHQLDSWKYTEAERMIFEHISSVYHAPLGDRKAIWKALQVAIQARKQADGPAKIDHSLDSFKAWLESYLGKPK